MKTPEKRAEPRTPARAVMVRVNGRYHHIYGFIQDISGSGMHLKTFTTSRPYPIDVGEKVRLEFRLPETGRDIRCEAEAVWKQSTDGRLGDVMHQGFRFIAVDPATRDELKIWVSGRH